MTSPTSDTAPEANSPWLDPAKEAFIRCEGLSKHYGKVTAVNAVDLQIYQGELFSILGGSGCGKTTLLRMLAGFEVPDAGRIWIDGVDVTSVAPYERPVNMMFQSYALFPHMSVSQNIAYGLKKDGMGKAQIAKRVTQMLNLVQMAEFAQRKPMQLSGGQRQRVALARALARGPKVLLLDEPLAALDKKLREHTQFELMDIQDRLGITFVVVTHDQDEAMTLSTRIAVMDEGRVAQIGTPRDVYEYPRSRFVADFVGNINLFDARVTTTDTLLEPRVQVDCPALEATLSCQLPEPAADQRTPPQAYRNGDEVCVAIRPEKIFLATDPSDATGDVLLSGTVLDLGYFGNLSVYRVRLGNGNIVQVSAQNRQRSRERGVQWDDEVFLSWHRDSPVLISA